MIRLKLFGPPLIEVNGSPLTELKNRKASALLFYLALRPGEHQRHQVATMFWPDLPEEKTLSNLRYNLWSLRQAITDLPLYAGRLAVAFKPDSQVWVDVQHFQNLLNKNIDLETNNEENLAHLKQAVELYHGDLLAGFELSSTPFFDEWLQERRTHFHLKAVDILTHLSQYYTSHHYLPEALDTTRRLLELEPWQEEAHQQMMLLLTLSGQRKVALEHYEAYRQKLSSEMDLEPEPETTALLERIRAGHLASISTPTPLLSENEGQPRPLFGRHQEYAWLIEQWASVCHHQRGRWVFLTGEAGVGKTRLVEEVGRQVEAQGGLFLQGRCYEFSDSVTYQPIATALRQKLPLFPLQAFGVGEIWLAELAQLLPEIYEHYGDLPPPLATDQSANRYRLFEAVTRFSQALARRQPVLLFIDDLHWVDSDTLDMLAYLVRRLAEVPLLLVGTYIPGEVSADQRLITLRHTLSRESLGEALPLERLAETAVAQIVEETFQAADVQPLSQMLYKLSQGNPFILFETIAEWLEQGGSDLLQRLSIPVSVQAMVERRLARLSDPSRQLLAVAAVIGNEFEVRLLTLASGLSQPEVIDTLEDWLRRHLIKEVNQAGLQPADKTSLSPGVWSYDFNHDLIRTIVYESLSQGRRQTCHHQVGLALETLYAAQSYKVIELLARHFQRSDDSAKALSYLQQAAQQAKTVYAWPVALKRYRQALYHLEKLHGEAGLNTPIEIWRQRWEFLLGQAQAHHIQGQVEEQQHLLDLVNRETSQWGDDEDKLEAIVQQLLYRPPLNNPERYRGLAEKGISLAQYRFDGVSENVCRQALGDIDLEAARFSQALAHYELALVGEAQWTHPYEAAFCLIKIGRTYLLTNRFSRAFSCLQEAVAYAKAGPYPDLLIWSLLEITRVYLFVGDLAKADQRCQEVLGLCNEIGFRLAVPLGLGLESYLHTLSSKLAQAQKTGEQAWKIAQEMGDAQIMAEVQSYLGHLHLAQEAPELALANFEQVQQLAQRMASSQLIAALSYQALAHLALGQLEPALTCSNQALTRLGERQNNVVAAQRIYLNHYKILQATQQMAQAQVVLAQAREIMHHQAAEINLAEQTGASLEAVREMFFTNLPWNREIVTSADGVLAARSQFSG